MRNIIEYLEATTLNVPHHIAIVHENKNITYQTYLMQARRHASVLIPRCRERTPIIVFMEKNIDALTVFMGIAYARCFYIYIDPKQHATRIQQIIDICQASLMITHGDPLPASVSFDGQSLDYQEMVNASIDYPTIATRQKDALDTDPLYCNFTSGTTGVPKGVVVSHRSVIDFIDKFVPTFNITHCDILANQAPFDFDVSVKDIYSALKSGARLVIIPKHYFSIITQLMDYLVAQKVTTLTWAVSALTMVVQFKGLSYKVPHTLNKILFSGEKMPLAMLQKWQKVLPDVTYVNLYGPTEITCNCTYEIIPKNVSDDYIMPIGIPFSNEGVLLLDDANGQIRKPNTTGEICVLGSGLALGYYNNPKQTSQAFVQNPLNTHYPECMYRTGDLGYYQDDGKLYYLGRKDLQIKHMGHRIELEGIESIAHKNQHITQACCFYREKAQQIVMCYSGKIDETQFKQYFIEHVPAYMVPTKIKRFDNLPLNNNGKLDRKHLQAVYEG